MFLTSFPSLTASVASLATKKTDASRMNGSSTRIHEMAESPLRHSQLRIQAQITTKRPFTNRVRIPKFFRNAESNPITANTRYSCAGVQYLLNSKFFIKLYKKIKRSHDKGNTTNKRTEQKKLDLVILYYTTNPKLFLRRVLFLGDLFTHNLLLHGCGGRFGFGLGLGLFLLLDLDLVVILLDDTTLVVRVGDDLVHLLGILGGAGR